MLPRALKAEYQPDRCADSHRGESKYPVSLQKCVRRPTCHGAGAATIDSSIGKDFRFGRWQPTARPFAGNDLWRFLGAHRRSGAGWSGGSASPRHAWIAGTGFSARLVSIFPSISIPTKPESQTERPRQRR